MTPQNRIFSNKYYKNILLGNAFFQSDRVLGADTRTRPYVEAFAANNDLFFQNFTCARSRPSIPYPILVLALLALLLGEMPNASMTASAPNDVHSVQSNCL